MYIHICGSALSWSLQKVKVLRKRIWWVFFHNLTENSTFFFSFLTGVYVFFFSFIALLHSVQQNAKQKWRKHFHSHSTGYFAFEKAKDFIENITYEHFVFKRVLALDISLNPLWAFDLDTSTHPISSSLFAMFWMYFVRSSSQQKHQFAVCCTFTMPAIISVRSHYAQSHCKWFNEIHQLVAVECFFSLFLTIKLPFNGNE